MGEKYRGNTTPDLLHDDARANREGQKGLAKWTSQGVLFQVRRAS